MSRGEQGVKNQFKGMNHPNSCEPLKQLCDCYIIITSRELEALEADSGGEAAAGAAGALRLAPWNP